MSSTATLRIKPGLRWFPAGAGWETVLIQVSDGAFKLFVYLCLNVQAPTGRLQFHQTDLARALGKSRRSIGAYLQELQNQCVCRVELGRNQYAGGTIQIDPQYWPYVSAEAGVASPSQEQTCYVRSIETFLQSRSCVRCRFSTIDRQLAEQWFHQGVELRRVEQAILLGCGRKYVSWLNGVDSQPIASLRYFEPVLQEMTRCKPSPEYHEFNRLQIKRLEQRWLYAQNRAKEIQVPAQTLRNQNTEIR
jgi:hypothetical protein